MEMVMKADHGTGVLLGAVALDHLAAEPEPGTAVGLDEATAFVAVGVGLDDDDVVDHLGGRDVGHGVTGYSGRFEGFGASGPDTVRRDPEESVRTRNDRSHPGNRRGVVPGPGP